MSVSLRHLKDGTPYWQTRFREDGKQTSLSWDNPRDAERCDDLIKKHGPVRAREILKILDTPRVELTVAKWLTQHVDHLTGVEPGTVRRYRAYIRNDLGALADLPLVNVSREDVSKWVADMGGSPKTIKNKRDFVSGALKLAVQAGHIKSNPCDGVKNPRWDRPPMVFLEREEFDLLLSCVTEYWRPLVTFLVSSGCRWSETTALQPADIDVKAGTVRITKAWKTGYGGYHLGPPKTKKSVRTVNVPARVLGQLDLTGQWVFTNSGRGKGQFSDKVVRDDAGPVRVHNFHPNVWAPAITKAKAQGLTKSPRIHDLRHTCASWLLKTRPMPAVQQHLGHESIQTTVDVYGHLDRTSGQGNADAIDAMLA